LHYQGLIGLIPSWIGAEMGDDAIRDKVEFQFENSQAEVQLTSLSERSRLDRIEGDLADLIGAAIISAVSTTHYDHGVTYFAMNIATGEGSVTIHWDGDGHIPFDVEVLGC